MKTKIMMIFLVACVSFGAWAADPVISDVVARQRWPWSQLVDIDYVLTCDATQRVDVALTAKDGSTTLTLPEESLSGDRYEVSHGMRRIIFDPMKTVYTNSHMLTQFSVTLTNTPVPVYMVVDLTLSAGAEGQIEYIYPGDPRLVTEGRWTNVWFGVTNEAAYMTTKLVLRRVCAGTVGSITVSNIFYAGVFEVTQEQWKNVMGSYISGTTFTVDRTTRPADHVSYNIVRENPNNTDDPTVYWPSNTAVNAGSFVGLLRTKTGFNTFDLPTEAQWEYACRAGTTTVFNDGDASANVSGANANTNSWLASLGRYKFNGGFYQDPATGALTRPGATFGPTNGTAKVGAYLPNAWGLYDLHGNVFEWCLDIYSGSWRTFRGGSWFGLPNDCTSTYRYGVPPGEQYDSSGFRIVLTLP